MLEMNGDIGKAREQKLRDRHEHRQERKEAMIRKNVKRNRRKDGETNGKDCYNIYSGGKRRQRWKRWSS